MFDSFALRCTMGRNMDNEALQFEAMFGSSEREPTYEEKLIQQVREIEGALNGLQAEGHPLEDINVLAREMISELDTGCPYIGTRVEVTGELIRRIDDIEVDDEYEPVYMTEIASSRSMTSRGFMAWHNKDSWRIVHLFAAVDEAVVGWDMTAREIVETPLLYGTIEGVDIAYSPTEEALLYSLQDKIPEIIEEVDQAIFGGGDFTSAITSLGDIIIDEHGHDIPDDLKAELLSYTARALDFDMSVPYFIQFKGTYLLFEEDDYSVCISDSNMPDGGTKKILAYVKGIGFSEDRMYSEGMCKLGDSERFSLYLRVVHDPKMGDDQQEYDISVFAHSFECIESLRHSIRS